MAKLAIGKAPTSFPLTVKIQTPHGEDEIVFDAKHLPSTEWAKLREAHTEVINKQVNSLFDAARKEAEKAYDKQADDEKKHSADEKELAIEALRKPVKESEIKALRAKSSASLILKIVNKWDLEDEFTDPVLVQMCDLYHAAPDAIFNGYGDALTGTRLGN
jgi:hypothetical protein